MTDFPNYLIKNLKKYELIDCFYCFCIFSMRKLKYLGFPIVFLKLEIKLFIHLKDQFLIKNSCFTSDNDKLLMNLSAYLLKS